MSRKYYLNQETNKIELRDLSKEEYQSLSDELKSQIKSNYLFSGKAQAWVSRSTNNHYSAIKTAEKLGFTEKEIIGERLSFAEEIQRQVEKAEARAERYEQYADNAEKRAEGLQSELNSFHGDVAFFTQPIIKGHSGSEAFARRRERIFDRYNKGFEEYRKSEYYKDRAETAKETASMEQFKNPVYLHNRIGECNKSIKAYEKHIVKYEELIYKKENNEIIEGYYNTKTIKEIQDWLNDTIDKMEYEIDKLAYLENCMEEVNKARKETGRKLYTRQDLKVGYQVRIRGTWETVLKINSKTVETQPIEERLKMFIMKYPFAEIQDLRIPEGFKEVEETKNPFAEGDIFVLYHFGSSKIRSAYQVLKVTAKGVTVKEINLDDNRKPIKDGFKIGAEELRRQITQNKYTKELRICINDYELNKYNLTA